MDQYAKTQPGGLSSGIETEQPLIVWKYRPKTLMIEIPQIMWGHMNKTWIHNSVTPNKHSQTNSSILSPANWPQVVLTGSKWHEAQVAQKQVAWSPSSRDSLPTDTSNFPI